MKMVMRAIFPMFPEEWGPRSAGLSVTGSDPKPKSKLAEVGVGLFLIVIFGSLAMFHALIVGNPHSLFSATLYAFAAAQGFRFFGKTDSLAARGALIATVCLLMGVIIGIG